MECLLFDAMECHEMSCYRSLWFPVIACSIGVSTLCHAEEVKWTASPAKAVVLPAANQEVVKNERPATIPATNKHPIDLETALRLANSQNPTIGRAMAQVRRAQAQQDQAEVLWLPNLTGGATYIRHDGQTQNQAGNVFGVSRSSVFSGGGTQLRIDTSDALFQPLVARRITGAASSDARATVNSIQLDVALGYVDLVQSYGLLAINQDILARAEKMLELAAAAEKSGVSKTAGDINRARAEVATRRMDRIDLEGRAAVASARLNRLLLLESSVELVPVDPAITPVTLVPPELNLDDLVGLAIRNRPELAANRELALAALERLRQARYGPLFPRVQIDYLAGTFGGGRNSYIGDFSGRGDLGAQAYWELRNFGFGNAAQVRERAADRDSTILQGVEIEARVRAEVTEALRVSQARSQALDEAQDAVREAAELYRKLLATQFGMVGPNARYDPLEALTAIQSLFQARVQYLNQVIDYNRYQLRLFVALGSPVDCAVPVVGSPKIDTPVIPAPEPKKKAK